MNGVDVSTCSHDEAVRMFMQAEEPITVEVKRRPAKSPPPDSAPELLNGGPQPAATTVSVGVQTEANDQLILGDVRQGVEEEEEPIFLGEEEESSPISEPIVNIFDECLVPDVDIEVCKWEPPGAIRSYIIIFI